MTTAPNVVRTATSPRASTPATRSDTRTYRPSAHVRDRPTALASGPRVFSGGIPPQKRPGCESEVVQTWPVTAGGIAQIDLSGHSIERPAYTVSASAGSRVPLLPSLHRVQPPSKKAGRSPHGTDRGRSAPRRRPLGRPAQWAVRRTTRPGGSNRGAHIRPNGLRLIRAHRSAGAACPEPFYYTHLSINKA